MGKVVSAITSPFKSATGTERFQSSESPLRGNLDRALGVLQQRVDGSRPSVAELQMQQGLDQNLADSITMARSAPGVSPALRQRMIGLAKFGQGTDLARAQSVLRAGEQAQAEQTLLSGIGQGMQADMGMQQMNQAAFESAQGRRGKLFGDVMKGAGSVAKMAAMGG